MTADPIARLESLRRQLLAAALEEAAFEDWTSRSLARAEAAAGLPEGAAALACPAGVVDLIDFWGLESDRAMTAKLAAIDLGALKVRERVAAGVRGRIEAIGLENREAGRRAAARLALPDAAPRAAAILWRASDAIWRAIGDRSTDGNFYSKRAILSGVLGSTLAAWLAAEEEAEAWRTLARGIEGVMAFEKLKAQVRTRLAGLPDLAQAAAALRYPRKR